MESGNIRSVFIVTKYKPRTLQGLINEDEIDDAQLKSILYSLLCSLKYLHQSNIVHRDISPDNILVDAKGVVLCDFGLARTLPESAQTTHDGNSIKLRDSELKNLKEE